MKWIKRYLTRFSITVIVMCAGVPLSIVAFRGARNWDFHRIQKTIARDTQNFVSALERQIGSDLAVVEAMGSLYANSHTVSREAFRDFARPFLSQHPSIQAVGWIPRVSHPQRAVYEKAARMSGFARFEITETGPDGHMMRASQREEYFPISFMEPYQGNEVFLGFDLASLDSHRTILNRSREAGEMMASVRISLVQGADYPFGFLVVLPIYQKGLPADFMENRQEGLEGFVLGILRIDALVEEALMYLEPQGFDIQLYDQGAPPGERLLYFLRAPTPLDTRASVDEREIDRLIGRSYAAKLHLPGREWLVLSWPTAGYIAALETWRPWGVLSVVLLSTAFLAIYSASFIGKARRIEDAVENRTSLLHEINEALKREVAEYATAEKTWRKHLVHVEALLRERTRELHRINERLRQEAALHKMAREKLGSRLPGGAANDFNNLLMAIQGHAELMLMTSKSGEPVYDDLQEIMMQSKRAGRLVNQLVGFS